MNETTTTTPSPEATDRPGTRRRPGRILLAAAVLAGGATTTVLRSVAADEPATATSFVPITPCRLLDTRGGDLNVGSRVGPLGAGETLTVTATGESGQCTLPSSATALSMNVVAISPTASSYLTVFPAGVTRPTASSLNWVTAQPPTPNAVTSALGTGGGLSLFNLAGTVELAVDVVGYFESVDAPEDGPAGPPGATGPVGPSGDDADPPNIVHVATSGGQFTSVSDALASITDASDSNRYVIRIAPGIYDEADPLTMQSFVELEGAGRDATVLRSADPAGTIVVNGAVGVLRDLQVVNTAGLGIDADTGAVSVELTRVSIDVSGGSTAMGVNAHERLVADDLFVEVSSPSGAVGVSVSDGDVRLSDLVVVATSSAVCAGFESSTTDVVADGLVVTTQSGCTVGRGVAMSGGSLTLRDSTLTITSSTMSTGVATYGTNVVASGLVVLASGGSSTDTAMSVIFNSAFVTDSDLRGAEISVVASNADAHVADSILSGATSGMSGRCSDVLTTSFTSFTCA